MGGDRTTSEAVGKNETPTPRRRSRRRRILVMCGIFLAVLVLAWGLFRIVLRAKINAELDRIRAEGYPATVEELAALYPPSAPGENAADLYRQAMAVALTDDAAYEGLPLLGEEDLLGRGKPLSPEIVARLERLAEDNREALRLIYEASAMKECRFVPDLTRVWMPPISWQGVDPWGDSTVEMNKLALKAFRILGAEMLLASSRNDGKRVADACAALWRVRDHLSGDPIFNTHAFGLFLRNIHSCALSDALSRTGLGDAELERLAAYLSEPFDRETFVRCAAAQRCGGSALFTSEAGGRFAAFLNAYNRAVRQRGRKPATSQVPILPPPLFPPPISYRWRALGYLDLEHLVFLRGMWRYVDHWERQARDQKTPVAASSGRLLGRESGMPPVYFPFLFIFEFSWPMYTGNINDALCIQPLARTAVAVELFRNRNGRLPETLEELVPKFLDEIPGDYYRDGPALYRKLDVGYVVYSVGQDLTDDGGEQNSNYFSPDVVFRVSR